jgi:hypothetical protein
LSANCFRLPFYLSRRKEYPHHKEWTRKVIFRQLAAVVGRLASAGGALRTVMQDREFRERSL